MVCRKICRNGLAWSEPGLEHNEVVPLARNYQNINSAPGSFNLFGSGM